MSVTLVVTFLDEETRYFTVGEDREFHTWYFREGGDTGIAALIFKRYPAPSASRVVIPVSQIRHVEVVNKEEHDAQVRATMPGADEPGGKVFPLHRDGDHVPAGTAGVDPDPLREQFRQRALIAAQQRQGERDAYNARVLARWRRQWAKDHDTELPLFGPSGALSLCPASPAYPCRWEPIEADDDLRVNLGANEVCARCRLVRIPGEHSSDQPERNLPGQVADGNAVLEDLGRSEVREQPGAGEREPAGPGGVQGVAQAGLEALVVPEGAVMMLCNRVMAGEHHPHTWWEPSNQQMMSCPGLPRSDQGR